MSNMLPDVFRIKTAIDNNRLSALLCAILDAVGPVTLTEEQASKVWEGRELQYETSPMGEITIALKPLLDEEWSSESEREEKS